MNAKLIMTAALGFGFIATASAAVENVKVSQADDSRRVTISYDLTGSNPAIVTIDIVTNGNVSVGGRQLRHLSGAVNRLVQPATGLVAYWQPNKDLPGLDSIDVKAVVTAWDKSTPPNYMVADLLEAENKGCYAYYADIDAIPGGFESETYKTTKMIFRRIPANGATYRMGSPSTESGRDGNREIPHYVSFSNDYWMAIYPLTIGQDTAVRDGVATYGVANCKPKSVDTFGTARGANWPALPTDGSFLGKFKARTGLAGDLPSDALYEFAHRAGVEGPICVKGYVYSADSAKVYWYSQSEWKEVGLLEANAWHLYDMAGNGTAWCLDRYYGGNDFRNTFGPNYLTEPIMDPIVLVPGGTTSIDNNNMVIRGSRYNSGVGDTRPSHRFWSQWNRDHCIVRVTIRID